MARRPTQQDIADSLGVSIITVHRALNDTGYVSDQLKERIRREAERQGYRPHRGARGLKRPARQLAVYSTESPAFHWDAVELGVRTAAAQIADFGYDTVYERIHRGDTAHYLRRLSNARRRGVAAVALVNNLEYDMEAVFALLDRWGVPYATLNIDAPTSNRRAFIGVDHAAEGRLAANFLAARARNGATLAVVSASTPAATSMEGADIARERLDGFRTVARGQGLRTRHVGVGLSEPATHERLAAELGSAPRCAGCYVMSSDPGLVRAAATAARGPIVVGADPPEIVDMLRDGVVTAIVYQNPVLQGYYAVRALEHLVEAPQADEPQRIVLVHSLMLRENAGLPDNHQLFVGGVPGR